MQDFVRVLQISDTHLFADTSKKLLGLNTQDSFAAVLEVIKQQSWQADTILLTGDLSQDESEPAYKRLAEQIATLKAPAYWIPGNHDNLALMQSSLTNGNLQAAKQILFKNWQIILLNSQIPGKVPGLLAKGELHFLKECLEQQPTRYSMICFHHPAIATGSHWLDPLGLKNAEELFATIEPYTQVKLILNGHIHQDFHGHHQKLPIYTTPSTCIQFKPQSEHFALDLVPPGFRYIELHSNGHVKTEVIRATQFKGHLQINPSAKGY